MKIIAQVLVYNEADYLRQAVEPFLKICENISVLEGAFQTTINLGYSKRSTDGTCEMGKELALNYSNVTYKEHNYWNEPILRNDHLFWTIRDYGREDTCLFILDGDEIYTEEDIKRCVQQVEAQWDTHNRWWVSMKNYIGAKDYYEGFRVPRFAKLQNALGFDSYNGVAYSDGVRETNIEGVCPKHISWWPLEKAARKMEWQRSLGWLCSFKLENEKVVLNADYYQQNGKIKPTILHD